MFCFNTSLEIQRDISRILGINLGKIPRRFLGIPLFEEFNKPTFWNRIMDNCMSRMESWKGKWLFSARRIVMLKSVISAIPFTLCNV